MKKVITFILSLIFITAFSQNLFAEIKFVSPLPGTWSNKQVLIIDNLQQGDYFYSINGSDPEKFGFAYDGPVLLDMNGEINLRVTYISRNGKKETANFNYTVIENDAIAEDYGSFISTFYDSGMINYSAGSVISIPKKMYYSLGYPPDSYIQGQELTLAGNSVLSRYVPCVIWNKEKDIKWRFVVKTFPQSAGIYSRRDVPFTITDWNTISFNDENFLYKIDTEYWELPKKPKTIDRTASHMIYWQSIDYNEGNPVEFFVLPPMPEICSRTERDGAITYYVQGDESYAMSVLSFDESQYQELFKEVGVDAFYGDRVAGTMDIGVFSNSVYQGQLSVDYRVDKRPPANPIITSNVNSFYSRENVKVTVQGEQNTQLFVAVSNPVLLNGQDTYYEEKNPEFEQVLADDFKLSDLSVVNVELQPVNDSAVYYKVRAYSVSGENISQISEYSVLIDQYNYYFDSSSESAIADGSMLNPFKNFEQCLEQINKSRSVCLKLKGTLEIPSGKHQLFANCKIVNSGDAAVQFNGDSSFVVKNATVEMENVRLLGKKGKASSIIPLFKLENSVLTLNNCEAGIEFGKNGTFIDSYKSVLNISDSIVSVSAISYASFVSSVKSRLNIKNSVLNSVADTTVLISANQGEVNVMDNSMKVSGKAGRIAELFAAEALFQKNTFNAQLTKKGGIIPLYADKETVLTQQNNTSYGF